MKQGGALQRDRIRLLCAPRYVLCNEVPLWTKIAKNCREGCILPKREIQGKIFGERLPRFRPAYWDFIVKLECRFGSCRPF